MSKLISFICLCTIFSSCITVNLGGSDGIDNITSDNVDELMLANPLNVYRTYTNTIMRVLVQDKNGRWVKSDKPVLIPSGWYMTSGIGIDSEETK